MPTPRMNEETKETLHSLGGKVEPLKRATLQVKRTRNQSHQGQSYLPLLLFYLSLLTTLFSLCYHPQHYYYYGGSFTPLDNHGNGNIVDFGVFSPNQMNATVKLLGYPNIHQNLRPCTGCTTHTRHLPRDIHILTKKLNNICLQHNHIMHRGILSTPPP